MDITVIVLFAFYIAIFVFGAYQSIQSTKRINKMIEHLKKETLLLEDSADYFEYVAKVVKSLGERPISKENPVFWRGTYFQISAESDAELFEQMKKHDKELFAMIADVRSGIPAKTLAEKELEQPTPALTKEDEEWLITLN